MDKRVILAVAGAGKTYYICHELNPDKRNLILAFTHENIHNIQQELCAAHGNVPSLTTVVTFDSFVYHDCILPYEPSIAEHFQNSGFISNGICAIDPPAKTILQNGRNVPNPKYIKKDKLEHYVTKSHQYYCSLLSELVLQVKRGRNSLIKRIADRLNRFYDYVLIDEFQDFREFDYDLIMMLAQQLNNVLLVGDYYQHSVSGTNNSGKPFKTNSSEVTYDEFISSLRTLGFDVDLTTLEKSRRCSPAVCNYVSLKLGIRIASQGDRNGSVVWVNTNASDVLENDEIVKLVYKDSSKYSFNSMNWSYSKGDTVGSACVILTDSFEQLDENRFSLREISSSTINKLYVAMTRSSGDLYIMKASVFKELKQNYII